MLSPSNNSLTLSKVSDFPKSPAHSFDSKTSSTKLSNSSFSDASVERNSSLMNYFESSTEKFYDEKELEQCLLSDLLKTIDNDIGCEDDIYEDSQNAAIQKEIYTNDAKEFKLNFDEPSFIPKSLLNGEQKWCKKDKNSKEFVLYKKKNQRKKGAKTDKSKGKKRKTFNERDGDWCCYKCKNINFSFRIKCNRCKLGKKDSEKMTEEAIDTLIDYFSQKQGK